MSGIRCLCNGPFIKHLANQDKCFGLDQLCIASNQFLVGNMYIGLRKNDGLHSSMIAFSAAQIDICHTHCLTVE